VQAESFGAVITLSTKVITLSTKVITLSTKVITLSTKVITLSTKVNSLSTKVITLSTKVNSLSTKKPKRVPGANANGNRSRNQGLRAAVAVGFPKGGSIMPRLIRIRAVRPPRSLHSWLRRVLGRS